jgi:guanylate kinase
MPIVVVSGPSGSGKTAIVDRVCQRTPYTRSVSCTTRTPRSGEQSGIDYHFVSAEQFSEMASDNKFLEYAEVSGNMYGTPNQLPNNTILAIDPHGLDQVRELYNPIAIFIAPPSKQVLLQRLVARGDPQHIIDGRMLEFDTFMSRKGDYDYVIVNDVLDAAVSEVCGILQGVC